MIGVSIICFDGTEHLEKVVSSLLFHSDVKIRIVENQFSRRGDSEQQPADSLRVQQVRQNFPVEYENVIDTRKCTDYYSIAKKENIQRVEEYQHWSRRGAEFCIVQDADEYYRPEQFADAVDRMRENTFGVSFAPIREYFVKRTYQVPGLSNTLVPFLCRPAKVQHYFPNVPDLNIDPTRNVHSADTKIIFSDDIVCMHHFSWVRDYPGGYYSKLKHSTAAVNAEFRQKRVEEILMLHPGHNLKNWPELIQVSEP